MAPTSNDTLQNPLILSANLRLSWVELFLTDGRSLAVRDRILFADFTSKAIEATKVLVSLSKYSERQLNLQICNALDSFDWEALVLPGQESKMLGQAFSVSRFILEDPQDDLAISASGVALRAAGVAAGNAPNVHAQLDFCVVMTSTELIENAAHLDLEVLQIFDPTFSLVQFQMFTDRLVKNIPLLIIDVSILTPAFRNAAEKVFEAVLVYRGEGNFLIPCLSASWMVGTKCSKAVSKIYQPGMRLYGDVDRLEAKPVALPQVAEHSHQYIVSLSYDLVDSTLMMARLGHERYSVLLSNFHNACQKAVLDFNGKPDSPNGDDGVMAYFGFPRAVENATAKAVYAGLAMIEAVSALGVEVRVGIAAGVTAIYAGQPVGLSVHHAARLQSSALPSTLLVSHDVLITVQAQFESSLIEQPLGLKGIGSEKIAYRILKAVERQDESFNGSAGREREVVGRHAALEQIRLGLRQINAIKLPLLIISGEPGIGKSMLIESILKSDLAQSLEFLVLRGLPEHQLSSFQALIKPLRKTLSDRRTSKHVGDVFHRALSSLSENSIEALTRLTDQNGAKPLTTTDSHVSAEAWRELALVALQEWLYAAASLRPVCVVLEDAHWIDPSTLELLTRLEELSHRPPIAVILTKRTENTLEWHPKGEITHIALGRLDPSDSRALLEAAAKPVTLEETVIEAVLDRAEGVPLYLVESGRMLAAQPAVNIDILKLPGTIQELLLARLDQALASKRVAQLGSVFGREFSSGHLKKLSRLLNDYAILDGLPFQLSELIKNGIISQSRNKTTDDKHKFTHILLRDVAYQSLWETDKRSLHALAASIFSQESGVNSNVTLEMVAHHLTESGDIASAISAWEKAAKAAASKSALRESVRLLGNALSLNAALAESTERDKTELRLQLGIAARYIASQGYGADTVQQSYGRANLLALKLNDAAALRKSHLGLEVYYFMRAEFDKALELLDRSQHANVEQATAWERIQQNWTRGNVFWHQGRLLDAVNQMNRCLDLYSADTHKSNSVQDPAVMSLCYSSWSYWEMGDSDEAMLRVKKGLALAQRLGHPFSIGVAQGFVATLLYFHQRFDEAMQMAKAAVQTCEENGFQVWAAHAQTIVGSILAATGNTVEGLAQMRAAYFRWISTGAMVTRPFYLSLQAQAHLDANEYGEALAIISEALSIANATGEHYHKAELLRQRALAALGKDSFAAEVITRARSDLEESQQLANSQGKTLFAQRSSTALSELKNTAHQLQGDHKTH